MCHIVKWRRWGVPGVPLGSRPNKSYLVIVSFHHSSHLSLHRLITNRFTNNKHLKNVGPIRHCEPPHAAWFTLPFTRCRYCRTPPLSHAACASMSTSTTTTTTRDRGDRYGPMEWAKLFLDNLYAIIIGTTVAHVGSS